MIEFLNPLAFILLLAPFMMPLLPLNYESKKQALYFPKFSILTEAQGGGKSQKPILKASWITRIVFYLVYASLVSALAKPILVEEPIVKEESLREVLICVDLSASMEAKDFKLTNGEITDRLTAQKEVLGAFIKRLSGENFALIYYGSSAFVQSPFTSDTNATIQLLNEAQIGMAGPKTVIGDAIGLGIKLFNEANIEERLIILMSDGSDSGSKVPPLKASELAKKEGIKIETIAVGDPNAKGEEKVDISTLKKIAEITGGNFYYANDSKNLENIYKEIDKLNPKNVKIHSFRPTKEMFPYALLLALFFIASYAVIFFIYSLLKDNNGK